MAVNTKHIDLEAAKASAREAALARKTCEGCTALRTYPRPMCAGEKSPHFRTARDTYHERCAFYGVALRQGQVEPEAANEPPPMSRREVAGEVPKLKRRATDSEHAALWARNATRKVSP